MQQDRREIVVRIVIDSRIRWPLVSEETQFETETFAPPFTMCDMCQAGGLDGHRQLSALVLESLVVRVQFQNLPLERGIDLLQSKHLAPKQTGRQNQLGYRGIPYLP